MLIALALFLLAAGRTAHASDAAFAEASLLEKFEGRTFKDSSGHALKYRFFKPPGYDSRTDYPLVLFLHGAAGSGSDNTRQFRGGNEVPPLTLTSESVQARCPC